MVIDDTQRPFRHGTTTIYIRRGGQKEGPVLGRDRTGCLKLCGNIRSERLNGPLPMKS